MTDRQQDNFDTLVLAGRWCTLLGYFGLMAGIYVWHLVINDTEKHLISLIIVLQIGPLLFALKGLLSGKVYTHAWSMYLAIYYFIVGVWYGATDDSFLYGLFVTLDSLLFFTGTVLYTRYRSKQIAAEQSEEQRGDSSSG